LAAAALPVPVAPFAVSAGGVVTGGAGGMLAAGGCRAGGGAIAVGLRAARRGKSLEEQDQLVLEPGI